MTMVTRRSIVTAAGAVVLGLLLATTGYTWTSSKTMYLSFSGPVALPGVTLPAGTYTFERVSDDIHIVRVSSRDQKTVYLTQFTELVDRPNRLPITQHITLGEARPGMAPPIKTWFPAGERQGHQFIYDVR
ncbi:MAG: hypothetical protein DMF89_18240 [Acidobacteria bacterium]|nr:MAG: hypothetical protein DMF90_13115 [Acidobacteriota bacterium]PYR47686.1 MAG: hypothetical protein DMF89_18240 [Acidobacteriota bacterium]